MWPLSVAIVLRVPTSHKRRVSSVLPDASVFPSGLKRTAHTPLVWPWSAAMLLRVATSHKRIVPSLLAVASVFPSGLNRQDFTGPRCAETVDSSLRVRRSQRRMPSGAEDASVFPSGLNVRLGTRRMSPLSVAVRSRLDTSQR